MELQRPIIGFWKVLLQEMTEEDGDHIIQSVKEVLAGCY